ncbi:MAG: hypothetical protein ABFC71_08890 [Methanoregula sp.]
MADFVPATITKSAVRKFADPLEDVTAFETIVQGVITNNPLLCVPYNASGVNHPPVERSRQGYTARVIYEDTDANQVGLITIRANDVAGFTTVANHVIADTAIATSLGGTPVRDSARETFTATLKCHDANGEIYYLNFSRSQVTLTSYTDDAIRIAVETWADSIPALG